MDNSRLIIVNNSSKYIFLFKKNLIRSLIESNFSVTVVSPNDGYADRIPELGAEYLNIKMDTNGMNPFKDLGYLFALIKCYKKIQPIAILTFTVKPNIYGTFIAGLLGIKSINNITGLGSIFLKNGVMQSFVKSLYRASFNFSTRVMFQNKTDKALFISANLVDPAKAELIPGSGVDTAHFKPLKVNRSGKIVFLMISRILEDKGVFEYIEAARLMKARFSNAEFWLLGDCDSGNPSSIGREAIKGWEADNIIRYLGEVEDVREFIAQSEVVVLPS